MTNNLALNNDHCYSMLGNRDPRFDGRFFVGVTSTGIYCRPVCRVKTPQKENCRFFRSAAAAEEAGFRPCLKCRPELAPHFHSENLTVRRAVAFIETEAQFDSDLYDLAERLNVGTEYLEQSFVAEYGVTPQRYWQTHKMLLAKRLLTDTALSLHEIALSAGFASEQDLKEAFQDKYKLAVDSLRKTLKTNAAKNGEITLSLSYRPPYDWGELIEFLDNRAVAGIERVVNGTYYRTVSIAKGGTAFRGWIAVANRPETNSLSVTLPVSLLPVLSKLLYKIRQLFDLDADPLVIYGNLGALKKHLQGECNEGLRIPGHFDSFETAVRAILGQQVTVKAARTLAMRLAHAFGEKIETPFEDLNVIFPTPEAILKIEPPLEDRLGSLGIIGSRSRSIQGLAEVLANGKASFAEWADPFEELGKFKQIKGIGPWTLQYFAMRIFGHPDAFPHTDYGVKIALPGLSPKEILDLSQNWKPWRSYATVNLWYSLKSEAQNEKQ
ncbi:MAG: AlkA N-terminal domain-containing protein [Dehalococcoidales bacterium]